MCDKVIVNMTYNELKYRSVKLRREGGRERGREGV